MSALALPEDWNGNLDELVEAANRFLPDILPLDKSRRGKEDINARLVRHYTSGRLLDEPLKQGREARYTRRHLLQLLVLRRLMAAGHGAAALHHVLRGKNTEELEALLTGEVQLGVQASNPALDYLEQLKRDRSPASPAPAAAPARPAPVTHPAAESYTRLTLAPGLEFHVRAGARLPNSKLEQDRLARALLDALDRLRSNA